MTPLFERFRPRDFAGIVGQDKAVSQLRRLEAAGGFAGRALWFTGPSGCGKTTAARIVAASVADAFSTIEYDSGADLTGSELDKLLDSTSLYGFGKGGRAVVVNESHSLRADIIDRLKGVLERIPRHVCWCFTTTREDEAELFGDHVGAAQLLSRCVRVSMTSQGLAKAFAEDFRIKAQSIGMDGKPVADYIKLMQRPDVRNNGRAAWNLIESGIMLD